MCTFCYIVGVVIMVADHHAGSLLQTKRTTSWISRYHCTVDASQSCTVLPLTAVVPTCRIVGKLGEWRYCRAQVNAVRMQFYAGRRLDGHHIGNVVHCLCCALHGDRAMSPSQLPFQSATRLTCRCRHPKRLTGIEVATYGDG